MTSTSLNNTRLRFDPIRTVGVGRTQTRMDYDLFLMDGWMFWLCYGLIYMSGGALQ